MRDRFGTTAVTRAVLLGRGQGTDDAAAPRLSVAAHGTISGVTTIGVDTPHGRRDAHLHPAESPRAALVLGHGAGGGVNARDLVAATGAANSAGVSVALVEQPYRVAGRRSRPRAPQLDAAWIAVVEPCAPASCGGLPLLVGGRSSGARVACRTAAATGAVGVLCLAFPLRPPSRARRAGEPSRLAELEA